MLDERMQEELNEQLNAELYSAYLYLSMSAYFEQEGLDGFANWMRVQAREETAHAMKLYQFMADCGGRVRLTAIDAPPADWGSPLAVFEQVAEHEAKVTSLIHALVDSAEEQKDHATRSFLQWFVTEQVEEEASAGQIVRRLRLVGDSGQGLFALDRELAARSFTPPATEEGGQ